jgi:hypothetical protein
MSRLAADLEESLAVKDREIERLKAGDPGLIEQLRADLVTRTESLRIAEDIITALRADLDRWKPKTNARVTDITATTATLRWDPVPGATGYLVGRTGVDNRGAGPWSNIDPPSATSRTFVWLKSGVYGFYVTAFPSGATEHLSVTIT